MSSVGWYRLEPATLDLLDDDMRRRVALAVANEPQAVFEGGR
jgi:hypothetical protein